MDEHIRVLILGISLIPSFRHFPTDKCLVVIFVNCRTFNYILRELPKVPTHVPVCVLGNHRDMGEHRVILPDDIRDLIAGLNR